VIRFFPGLLLLLLPDLLLPDLLIPDLLLLPDSLPPAAAGAGVPPGGKVAHASTIVLLLTLRCMAHWSGPRPPPPPKKT
jgi:hypothetical protein